MTARDAVLDLKREFICEALDLAHIHMAWASRHLQSCRDKEAVVAFDKFVNAARAAVDEMKAIRATVADPLTEEAAAEYRRDRQHSPSPNSSKQAAA